MSDDRQAGAQAVRDKCAAVISAEGIKGNAKLMSVAIDLAIKSPDMSAADVIAYVRAHIAGGSTNSQASLASRIAAMAANGEDDPLGTGSPFAVAGSDSGWSEAFAQANSQRKALI